MPEPTETPPTETPGQEPVTPTETPTETPAVEPGESPTLPESTPTEPAPVLSPEEQRHHDTKSWMGRKIAEVKTDITNQNQALLEEIRGMVPQPQPALATPEVAPDPGEDANAWFKYMLKESVGTEQTFNETLITTGVAIIDNDPLVKFEPAIKDEIIQEIQSGRVVINRGLDPGVAAQNAVTEAKSNILTRRATKQVNPLATNTPATEPLGGVAPPATPTTPAVELPPMSDLAKDAMKLWNISPEEAIKILNQP